MLTRTKLLFLFKTMSKTIQLQSIGRVNAVPAIDLKVGDTTIWNFGYTETIAKVAKETAKTITFEISCNTTGKTLQRRLNKTRLVGII